MNKIVTLIRLDNGQPFVSRATMFNNVDGSVSFQLSDNNNKLVGQEPNIVGQPSTYGTRYPDSDVCGSYQRATLAGNLVTFLTRPQDIPCTYLLAVGQVY